MNFGPVIFSAEAFELIGSEHAGNIPLQLELSSRSIIWIAMIGLSSSFFLLAMSRMASSSLISIFSRILYKNVNVLKIVKEEFSLKSFTSVILLLNFVLTTSTLLYLSYLNFYTTHRFELVFFLPAIPLYFFLWPMISLALVGFITDQSELLKESRYNNIIVSQVTGILFSLLLVLWTFNLAWSPYFIYVFLSISVLAWIYKLLRGIIFSISKGVAWYYIILYFCTLEILPMILIYSVYKSQMKGFWTFV